MAPFILFVALRTQWIHHPVIGTRTGLRYEAIAPTAGNMHVELTPALFADLRIMEEEALASWAKR